MDFTLKKIEIMHMEQVVTEQVVNVIGTLNKDGCISYTASVYDQDFEGMKKISPLRNKRSTFTGVTPPVEVEEDFDERDFLICYFLQNFTYDNIYIELDGE